MHSLSEINLSNHIADRAVCLWLNIIGTISRTGFYNIDFIIIALPYIITVSEITTVVYLLKKAISTAADEFDGFIAAKFRNSLLGITYTEVMFHKLQPGCRDESMREMYSWIKFLILLL